MQSDLIFLQLVKTLVSYRNAKMSSTQVYVSETIFVWPPGAKDGSTEYSGFSTDGGCVYKRHGAWHVTLLTYTQVKSLDISYLSKGNSASY